MENESQPKFTSGPWFAVDYAGCFVIQNTNDYNGLDLLDIDDVGKIHAAANASLIATAPAMYAAMQDFCDRVERGEVRSRKTYEQFKSIIALARGENQPQP